MSQHDFNIANQSFPATRTDLNNALVALASNSSGDAEPATKYANQWWYETDTNTLKLRNEANDAWISIAVLDQSGNAVQSITTAGLTLGSTAISATGTEINQLDAITRGSILYGNASGATARLAKGGASTVLTSDGTDIAWAAVSSGYEATVFPSDWTSPTNTYTSSGTWSKGSLADDDRVWLYLLGSGGGGGITGTQGAGGWGGTALLVYGTAKLFNGAAYVIGAQVNGSTSTGGNNIAPNNTTFTLTSGNGGTVYTTASTSSSSGNPTAIQLSVTASSGTYIVGTESSHTVFSMQSLPSGRENWFNSPGGRTNSSDVFDSVFGGGHGGGAENTDSRPAATSLLSGNGGASSISTSAGNGTYPGGGGGGCKSGTSGFGAAGNLRVYHV